ncbi:hypothetical protein K1719_005592 [Acacia pycnantha]|nr:hypothetical protein K1719_005592 [Acacia pycnantha]
MGQKFTYETRKAASSLVENSIERSGDIATEADASAGGAREKERANYDFNGNLDFRSARGNYFIHPLSIAYVLIISTN